MHHAISDGWSIGILIREVSVLYESFLDGESSPLPELAIQYADYAVWQRNWLQGEILDAQLGYWTKQLAGLPDLELPTDRPRQPVASRRGGERSTTLPKATLEAVRALGRREGATLYMTLACGVPGTSCTAYPVRTTSPSGRRSPGERTRSWRA